MDETDALTETAVFGKRVEDFLASDIGRYLLLRAEEEAKDALADLRACGPDELRDVQARVWRAESIREWLMEAIENGYSAIELLDEQRG